MNVLNPFMRAYASYTESEKSEWTDLIKDKRLEIMNYGGQESVWISLTTLHPTLHPTTIVRHKSHRGDLFILDKNLGSEKVIEHFDCVTEGNRYKVHGTDYILPDTQIVCAKSIRPYTFPEPEHVEKTSKYIDIRIDWTDPRAGKSTKAGESETTSGRRLNSLSLGITTSPLGNYVFMGYVHDDESSKTFCNLSSSYYMEGKIVWTEPYMTDNPSTKIISRATHTRWIKIPNFN